MVVELELAVSDAPRSLTRREADVAVRRTDSPPEHLVGRPVARVEFALYAERTLVDGAAPTPELADLPWLAWDEAKEARLTAAWMKRQVPDARIACRHDSAFAMLVAVRAGRALARRCCPASTPTPSRRCAVYGRRSRASTWESGCSPIPNFE